MKTKKAAKEITVTGLLKAVDWDEDGNTTCVSILTRNEEDYLVSPKGLGSELSKLEQSKVEVTGTIKNDKNGNSIITVTEYKVLAQGSWEGEGVEPEEESEDYLEEV